MNKSITTVAAFLLGAATGAVATWYGIKTYYERLANEEIESVKEVFANREPMEKPEEDSKDESAKPTRATTLVNNYSNLVNSIGYELHDNGVDELEEEKNQIQVKQYDPEASDKPYIIDEPDYDIHDDWEMIELTYYSDGVLTDDEDEPIENPEETVGDGLKKFIENDYQTVYVRNDKRRCDYEIAYCPQPYAGSHI